MKENKKRTLKLALLFIAFIMLLSTTFVFIACGPDDNDGEYSNEINRNAVSVNSNLPFSKGVNFSAWFEKDSPAGINFVYYTEQDFIDVKNMGVDVVRVPIRFHNMTISATDHTLDPVFLKMLDIVVDWAEKHGLYLILDNHSWSPTVGTSDDVGDILIPIWQQVAFRYKSKSDFLIYEVQNEPHEIEQSLWSKIQGDVVDAIKDVDANCRILVTGTEFGSIDGMRALPIYKHSNIMYSFHFYDPHLFTHQGQTWAPPSFLNLANLPFPADAHAMPALPDDLKGTWAEAQFNNYKSAATVSALEKSLDAAVKFANDNNVPVFCGEFGVYIRNSMHEDRVRWYEIVSELLRIRNITYTSWDYYGGFGLFSGGIGLAEYDINVDIARALGFNPPEQKIKTPINSAFTIYDNGPKTVFAGFSSWDGNINYYYGDGQSYSLSWGNVSRYGYLNMTFRQNVDFESLNKNNYELSLRIKVSKASSFNVRLLNSDQGGKLPWRRDKTVEFKPSKDWQTVSFKLSDMPEAGAWSNAASAFIEPRGEFKWNEISALQLVAENGNITSDILIGSISVNAPK